MYVLQNIMHKFATQLEECIGKNGGHLRNSMLKS